MIEINLNPYSDFEGTKTISTPWEIEEKDARLRLNLFDPHPRFVSVGSVAGWGKSALAMSLALAHANNAGNVCLVDPYLRSVVQPQDWAGKIRIGLLKVDGGSQQVVGPEGVLKPFSRITGIGFQDPETERPPLALLLSNIRKQLLPFSVLVIDEPAAFSDFPGQGQQIAREIDCILESGSSVIWISQEPMTDEALLLSKSAQDNSVHIVGKLFSWARLPEGQAEFFQLTQSLPMKRGIFNGWIAGICAAGKPTAVWVIKVYSEQIEDQVRKSSED